MKLNKTILIALLFTVIISSSYSQYMKIENTNGETQQIDLSDIRSINYNISGFEKYNGLSGIQSFNKLIVHSSLSNQEILLSEIDSISFNNDGSIIYILTVNGLNQFSTADIDSLTFGGILDSTIYVTYSDTSVNIINPMESSGVAIDVNGSDVVVNSSSGISNLNYVLSGTNANGMFKIYSDKKLNLILNNIQLTNDDGPAINIQSGKKITVELIDASTNILTDGIVYSAPPDSEDQDAAFFSEGQLIFTGSGNLTINGRGTDQHALKSDDFIEIDNGNIVINSAVKDGINANDGFYMHGGTVNVTSDGDGIDGNESSVEIYNGSVTISGAGDNKTALHADSLVYISGGTLNLIVQGDQSKGISSDRLINLAGANISINTSGGVVLTASGSGYDPSYCTAIKSDSLLIIDSCSIEITGTGIAGRGISCDGIIKINSGTLGIHSTGNGGTYTNSSGQLDAYTGNCINSDGSIYIIGGEITLTNSGSGGKGISCDANIVFGSNDSQPVLNLTTTGSPITISNGNYAEAKAISADSLVDIENGILTIHSADDGIKSKYYVKINGGTVNIAQSKEGIESPNIFVNGGDVSVNASDDGFNGTYGNGGEFDDGSNVTFNNGYVFVNTTQGDAIDSNGDIFFNGGIIVAHGPLSSPEVGMDYNGLCKVTGGFIVISGTNSNMTQAPGNTSTQYSLLMKTTQSINAGTLFHLEDASGNSLLTFAPIRRYYSIVFSSSSLVNGTIYKISTGGTCTGVLRDGLYTGGTYSGGTLRKTFTLNSIVQTVTF